jgi:hypothetical protein
MSPATPEGCLRGWSGTSENRVREQPPPVLDERSPLRHFDRSDQSPVRGSQCLGSPLIFYQLPSKVDLKVVEANTAGPRVAPTRS